MQYSNCVFYNGNDARIEVPQVATDADNMPADFSAIDPLVGTYNVRCN